MIGTSNDLLSILVGSEKTECIMETFIVVFTLKRNIGLTAIAYHAHFVNDKPIKLIEQITLNHINYSTTKYRAQEIEIIKILSAISEQGLYKRFSNHRSSSLKDFMSGLISDNRFKTLIRPFIKNKLYDAIRVLAESQTLTFFKDDTFTEIYPANQLFVFSQPAQPCFRFDLQDNTLFYTFKIKQLDEKSGSFKTFSLNNVNIRFVTTEPVSFIIDNRLYYSDTLDFKKMLPFLKNLLIEVPPHQVKDYMKKEVADTISYHNIDYHGFTIDVVTKSPTVLLKLSSDLKQISALSLYISYDSHRFLADKGANVFVEFQENEKGYHFTKINRNYAVENEVFDLLESLGLKKVGGALFRPTKAIEETEEGIIKSIVVHWLNEHAAVLNKHSISIIKDEKDENLYIGPYTLALKTSDKSDWFEIDARVKIDSFEIPFFKFRKNIIDIEPEYVLPNGEVFMLPAEWFTRFSDLFYYAKVSEEKIRLPRSHFQVVEEINRQPTSYDDEKKPVVLFPQSELPKNLLATLRPYQREGFDWLKFLNTNYFGGILADDMGLGKTLQTIALLLKIYSINGDYESGIGYQTQLFDFTPVSKFNKSGVDASIIVMPTSLLHNWQNEILKFAPTLKVYSYSGKNRLRSQDLGKILRHYHIVLISYGVLRNDIEYLKSYNFHYVILDESQYVKNPSSKIYAAINELKCLHKLVLTGTPIENSLIDLWAQMNFVNKNLLGTLNFFRNHFVLPITRQNDEAKKEKLQKLIQPFLLRRTKENVAKDLPPITEQTIYCEMTFEQASIYEKEKSGIRNTLLNIFDSTSKAESSIITLQALSKLRQLANHPAMVDKDYKEGSGKFEQVLDTLEEIVAGNHHVLIFSSFVKDLKLIEKELLQRRITYSILTGSTLKREKAIDHFNKSASVFLISLKAGGVGLNLIKADYVFMLNPWWNPAAESQAINRAHRIGQTKNIFVYKFISVNTIEEKIAVLQEKKRELAQTFVSSNNILKELTQEEIMALLD